MPFAIACPNCDARLQAPDTVEGKRIKCKMCGETFVARPVEEDKEDRPARSAAKAAARPRPRPVDEDEDVDDRPRRSAEAARQDDEDDYEDNDHPRRRHREAADEDEPRPRKKKGKKKKAAGPPVLLLVLIGVGALVLIGGGIGIYLAFIKENKPADQPVADASKGAVAPGGPNRTKGGGGTDGWVEHHDAEGQFRVKFPQRPTTPITQQRPLPNGETLELKLLVVNLGPEAFIVGHAALTAGLKEVPTDRLLDMTSNDEYARAKGAVIKSRAPITYQGFPGREVVLDFPGKKTPTVMRVLVAKDRLFILVVASENASPELPRVKGFFESLTIE